MLAKISISGRYRLINIVVVVLAAIIAGAVLLVTSSPSRDQQTKAAPAGVASTAAETKPAEVKAAQESPDLAPTLLGALDDALEARGLRRLDVGDHRDLLVEVGFHAAAELFDVRLAGASANLPGRDYGCNPVRRSKLANRGSACRLSNRGGRPPAWASRDTSPGSPPTG